MNARENALRIIRFDHPERVMGEPPLHELRYWGCDHQGYNGGGDASSLGCRWVDIWGTRWHKLQPGVMAMPVGYPLADARDLARYEWPDPHDARICGQIYELAQAWTRGDELLAGSHRDTLWEKAYMLVGMERMMMAFHDAPSFAREVLRRIMDFQIGIAEHYLRLGVELVKLSDDLGCQAGALLGPRIVDEFLMPEYERLCRLYRQRGVIIWFHCCGAVESVLEPLQRLGVQILHPVQATANDLDRVRRLTAGRMALHGGVNSATVLEGPTDRIRSEVRQRIAQLGREGGYFCAADQSLPYPAEHLRALQEAVDDFGQYPLPVAVT